MKKGILTETLFLKNKRQEALEKNLIVILFILVKKIMTQTKILVEYKHLLVTLKIKKLRKLEKELKEKLNL